MATEKPGKCLHCGSPCASGDVYCPTCREKLDGPAGQTDGKPQAYPPSKSHWRSGALAGLVGLIPFVFLPLFSAREDTAVLLGYLFCFIYPAWFVASAAFGVRLYRNAGNSVTTRDGVYVGGISAMYLIVFSLGFGILGETVLYNPDNLVRGSTLLMCIVLAVVAFVAGCFGGVLGVIFFKK